MQRTNRSTNVEPTTHSTPITVAGKVNPGALAIYQLLGLRNTVQDEYRDFGTESLDSFNAVTTDPIQAKKYDDANLGSRLRGYVQFGLPQFSETDTECDRVSTINELFALATDLVTGGQLTEKQADALNQAFHNMTGHHPMIDVRGGA